MKIYIAADMEGISGVSGSSYVVSDQPNYGAGRRMLTDDVNICAKACFEAGADEVVVRDIHGSGNNILWQDMLPGVKLLQGMTVNKRFFGIEGSAGVILLGYHAMAGTRQALLEHTFNSKSIQNMWMNGQKVGEFAIDAAIAGDYGIPVIMTSGCDKLCAEARAFLPSVVTCQVKESASLQGALLLSPKDAHELLRAKTMEAIAKLKQGKCDVINVSPCTLRIEWMERLAPEARLVDVRTTECHGDTAEEAFLKR